MDGWMDVCMYVCMYAEEDDDGAAEGDGGSLVSGKAGGPDI